MYSQDSIYGRRRDRPEPAREVLSGLACLMCGTGYRNAPDPEVMVVSHRDDKQPLACRGTCARMASGAVNGLDETPVPPAERVRRRGGDGS